jgi:hypothetical protein
MTDEFMKLIAGQAPLCPSKRNARTKGTFFVERLAMLCTLEEDLRGRNGGRRQAAHAQSTREMTISSLLALAWELKPTADLGPAWDGCAESADIRQRASRLISATESSKGMVWPCKPLIGIDLMRPCGCQISNCFSAALTQQVTRCPVSLRLT